MWPFEGIDEPAIVKDEHLPVARALGILSLLPLAKADEPKKLLQRLMLANVAPALLIDVSAGRELRISQGFWQSERANAVFSQLRVTVWFDGSAATAWRGFNALGHVVIQFAQFQRAVVPLIEEPALPEHVTIARTHTNTRHLVAQFITHAQQSVFDKAVKHWLAAGPNAQKIDRPLFSAKVESEAERIARLAELQERSKSLGNLPGTAPDLGPDLVGLDTRGGIVIDGQSKRIEPAIRDFLLSPVSPPVSSDLPPLPEALLSRWVMERAAKLHDGEAPPTQEMLEHELAGNFPDHSLTQDRFRQAIKGTRLHTTKRGPRRTQNS